MGPAGGLLPRGPSRRHKPGQRPRGGAEPGLRRPGAREPGGRAHGARVRAHQLRRPLWGAGAGGDRPLLRLVRGGWHLPGRGEHRLRRPALLRRALRLHKGAGRAGGPQPGHPDQRVLHVRRGHRRELRGFPRHLHGGLLVPGMGLGLPAGAFLASGLRRSGGGGDVKGRLPEQAAQRGLDLRHPGRSPQPLGHPARPGLLGGRAAGCCRHGRRDAADGVCSGGEPCPLCAARDRLLADPCAGELVRLRRAERRGRVRAGAQRGRWTLRARLVAGALRHRGDPPARSRRPRLQDPGPGRSRERRRLGLVPDLLARRQAGGRGRGRLPHGPVEAGTGGRGLRRGAPVREGSPGGSPVRLRGPRGRLGGGRGAEPRQGRGVGRRGTGGDRGSLWRDGQGAGGRLPQGLRRAGDALAGDPASGIGQPPSPPGPGSTWTPFWWWIRGRSGRRAPPPRRRDGFRIPSRVG
ncbi:hypothetical protein Rxycam_01552 [Rubrobacter xylanophilus DSM 9941]|nr:hypothetical protein Rxycam_01552 [Rubrobacter xylanophilus DSM 9941]